MPCAPASRTGLAASGLYPGQDGVIQLLSNDDGLTPVRLRSVWGEGTDDDPHHRTHGGAGLRIPPADDRDARLTKVFLTEEGRSSLERIAAATVDCEREATLGLSNKELRTLVKLLAAVESNLSGKGSPPASPTCLMKTIENSD